MSARADCLEADCAHCSPAEAPDPGAEIQCGCCQTAYGDDNDLVLFGILKDANGKTWPLCGPCIQVMWRERAPKPDPTGM